MKRLIVFLLLYCLTVCGSQAGQEPLTLKGHSGPVLNAAFSPNGKRIVSGDGGPVDGQLQGTVKVWDADTGQELLTLEGHSGPVWGVAFSPDGKRVVSGGYDKTVKVWELSSLDKSR